MTNSMGCQCPNCGAALNLPMQQQMGAFGPGFGQGFSQGFGPGFGQGFGNPYAYGPSPDLSSMGTMPGTYLSSFAGPGMADDEELREMVLTSLDADPRIPFDSDISVDVTAGIVTLSGTVPNKRIKHAVGDDAWWIPDVVDVNNELEVSKRRQRSGERSSSQE